MRNPLESNTNIETPFLKICGNCLMFENTTIQLSNISLFSTSDIAPPKFPIYSVVLLFLGLGFLSINALFGLLLLGAGGGWIYYWYVSSQKAKILKRLTIVTNSGNIFPIVFEDQKFMKQVADVMKSIIIDSNHNSNINIDIKSCTLSGDASIIENINS